MANRRFIDFPIASTVGDNDIVLIWQDGLNKQTTKGTLIQGAPTTLEGLTDVDIAGLINGQILQYNSVTGKWENVDRAGLNLSELGDVSIVSPSNGQVLVYNSTTSKWENSSGGYVPYTGAVTTVDLGAQGLRAGYIRFDTSVVSVPDEQGLMYWDDSRSTVALIMNGTLQHIGQDTFFYVKNSTGSSIAKGTAVRFDGTDGASGHLLISPFLANGTYPSNYFMGVTAETIGNGSFGQVMHFGELSGINTSGYTAGALLYASTTVAGGFQTTAPVAPNNIVLIAAAINSKNNGEILVRPTYGSNINQDEGVKIVSPTTGQLLQLQSNGLWENKTKAQVLGGTSSQFVKGDGSLDSTTYQSTADKGQPNGYASLDSNGKVPLTQINDALIGNVNYQGLWNASTNTPTLANPPSSGTKGYYYIVSTAGTFAGISFEVGDWIISNGSAWQKVDNTDAVSSVFGRTGNVVAANGDYTTAQVTESGNLYFTQARVSANTDVAANTAARHNAVTLGTANGLSLSTQVLSLGLASAGVTGALSGTDWSTFNSKQNALTLTTTGTSGAATLVGSTLNIPQYQAAGTYVTAVTASSPLFSSGGTTPNITIQQASGSQSGFLSSTDWTTFNNKQNALTNPVTGTGTTNYLPKFTGSTTIGNSELFETSNKIGYNTGSPVGGGGAGDRTLAVNANSGSAAFMTGMVGGTRYSTLFTSSSIFVIETNADIPIQFNANNNARMSIFTNGNVSISNSPSDAGFKLDVNGTGRFSGNLILSPTGYLGFGGGTNYMEGDNTNNIVRIGTNNVPRLTINSTGAATFSSSVTAGNTIRMSNSAVNRAVIIGVDSASEPSIQAVVNNSDIPRQLSINPSGGNVGIGTASPIGKLDVALLDSRRFIVTYDDSIITIKGASNTGGGENIRIIGDNILFNSGSSGSGTERLRITSGGNVGIGIDSPTNYSGFNTLHINGKSGTNGGVLRLTAFDNSSSFNIYAAASAANFNTTSAIPFVWLTQDTPRMTITSGGNVLIGTATDNSNKLRVEGNGYFSSDLTVLGFSGLREVSGLYFSPNGTTVPSIAMYRAGTDAIGFSTNTTPRLIINSGGNILIGTQTNSGDRLRVAGTTFSDEIMTLLPEAESRSNINWRFGAASIASITPNRRLRVKVGGVEYYIAAVEV